MVLEQLFNIDVAGKRPYLSFFYGVVLTLIGSLIAFLFMKDNISLATIFFATMLLIPSLKNLLSNEEELEETNDKQHFLSIHKNIIEIYLFTFLGIFTTYIFLSFIFGSSLFAFQDGFLGNSVETFKLFKLTGPSDPLMQLVGILSNNLLVLIVCFIFSFLYGASAIFLIILNASVFARFITSLMASADLTNGVMMLMSFLVHTLPEIGGFLIAAIAGGVVSKAVLQKGKKGFKNVINNAIILLMISVILIITGALLEVFVTTNLFFYYL